MILRKNQDEEDLNFMYKEMLDIDYEYDLVLKKFMLSFYDGAKKYSCWVMNKYVITLLESKLISNKMFIIVLNEVFDEIKTLYSDMPLFIPELV